MWLLFLKPFIQNLALWNHRIVILCILPKILYQVVTPGISMMQWCTIPLEYPLLLSPNSFCCPLTFVRHIRFCGSTEFSREFHDISLSNNEKPYFFSLFLNTLLIIRMLGKWLSSHVTRKGKKKKIVLKPRPTSTAWSMTVLRAINISKNLKCKQIYRAAS